MTEQSVFNIYCFVVVGILGNALIGWEIGQKGFVRLGLEGPKNKRISFALYCFMLMMIWQIVRHLKSPFTDWRDLWMPLWGVSVLFVSYFLVPKSMRIYSNAKFLHETTYTGNWLNPEPDIIRAELQNNARLLKAESLYLKAIGIQKRLSDESQHDTEFMHHMRNVVITYSQLALLYLQQRKFTKASMMSRKAIQSAESLNIRTPNKREVLSALSTAYFRDAEIEQCQGNFCSAKAKYEQSLSIDRKLGNDDDANSAMNRLKEIEKMEIEAIGGE